MMKILFVGAPQSNHTAKWVNALAQRGHKVLLAGRKDQEDVLSQVSDKVMIRYLHFGGGVGYYLNVMQMRKIYQSFCPDIVNVHYASGYGTLCRIAKMKPLVMSCWGSDIFDFPRRSFLNRIVLRKNFKYADIITSTSNAMAIEAKKYIENKNKELKIIPFGIDTSLFCPVLTKRNKKKLVIGIVKHLEPNYDIPLLLKSFAIVLKKTCSEPILRIYGDGFQKEELKGLAVKLHIDHAVSFMGEISNMSVPKALQSLDIFVNCSKAESFGVSILEAMACELPVIVTQTEGSCEIVKDGENGIILKDRCPESLAGAIIRLLENENLREEYGKAGRRHVEKHYEWSKNVDDMVRLYREIRTGVYCE